MPRNQTPLHPRRKAKPGPRDGKGQVRQAKPDHWWEFRSYRCKRHGPSLAIILVFGRDEWIAPVKCCARCETFDLGPYTKAEILATALNFKEWASEHVGASIARRFR